MSSKVLQLYLILLIGIYATLECLGMGCVQTGQCQCKFEDGSEIDLIPLGKRDGGALISDVVVDSYKYSYNPCFPFTEGTCTNVSACQSYIPDVKYYDLGDPDTANLTYDGVNVVATYSSTGELGNLRRSIVNFICDPSATSPKTEVFGETRLLEYRFAVTSVHACRKNLPTTTSKTPSTTPKHSCHTNYGDFIKRCNYSYDGHEEPVKVVIIQNWDGSCVFPTSAEVAVSLYSNQSTCAGVTNRCHPRQAFSVNGHVCQEV